MNEVSKLAIKFIKDNELKYELAPARDHHTLPAERAIQTFKDHFVATLYGADKDYPTNQWDRLLPQAQLTCNLMQQSKINPKLSAYAQVWGQYDYNAHPLAPPGCKCIIHDSPRERSTFAKHGTVGFYVGPAMNHYRCYEVYVPETGGIRTGLTVEFFPKHVQMPKNTPEDRLAAALEDIKTITQGQYDDTNSAIEELRAILSPPKDSIQPPRVKAHQKNPKEKNSLSPPAESKPKKQYKIGTMMKKIIHGIPYRGQIMRYEPKHALYWIDYENGEHKELQNNEIEQHICEDHHHNKIRRFTRSAIKPTQYVVNITQQSKQPAYSPISAGFANAIYDETTEKMLTYKTLLNHPNATKRTIWQTSAANEWGRLLKGVGTSTTGTSRVKGYETIRFILPQQIPTGKKISYGRFVCEERPQKDEVQRTRLTLGGDRIEYDGDTATEVASMNTIQNFLNSVISTTKARFAAADIGNFYTNSRLP